MTVVDVGVAVVPSVETMPVGGGVESGQRWRGTAATAGVFVCTKQIASDVSPAVAAGECHCVFRPPPMKFVKMLCQLTMAVNNTPPRTPSKNVFTLGRGASEWSRNGNRHVDVSPIRFDVERLFICPGGVWL